MHTARPPPLWLLGSLQQNCKSSPYIVLYIHLVFRGFTGQNSIWRLGAVMQCCLLIWFCSVVLSWATGWRLFGWAMRSSVWLNGLQGGQGWKIESHTHIRIHTQSQDTDVSNTKTQPSSHSPLSLSFISLSPSVSFLIALLPAVCKFIHCENGRRLCAAQFHLVFYSVSHRVPACFSHPHFRWN